jgi:hypothetical protein
LSSVEIRGAEAVWVLGAHFYALVVPLVLCLVTSHHWGYLVATTDAPFLFYIAAVILVAGSAFEIAQNSIDKWYLTAETASANGVSFCDMLFYGFVTAGQGIMAVAIAGDTSWVSAIALAAVVIFPVCYLTQTAQYVPMGVTGLLVAVTGYQAFGDPIIFLSVFLPGATMYFFGALLKTGAQVLHGCTTSVASSGLWFFAWAVHNGDAGTPSSWWFGGGILAATAIVLAAAWPFVSKLPASTRVVRPVA